MAFYRYLPTYLDIEYLVVAPVVRIFPYLPISERYLLMYVSTLAI